MKILFIGDYSNMHACMASELRRRGHQCTVVSDGGGYLKTSADNVIVRTPGVVGGVKYLFEIFSMLPEWKDYDLVQLNNPHFFNLRPGKLKYLFDRLAGENKQIGLTLASNDYFFVKACQDAVMFRFSEFRIGKNPTDFIRFSPSREQGWTSKDVAVYNEYVYSKINSAVSLLPEYDMAARPILGDKCLFINLPVELARLKYQTPDINGPLRLFIGLSKGREVQKGTDRLLKMAKSLKQEMGDKVDLVEARNLPLNDYLRQMQGSNVVLDQLYSYSPATNALQAMAMGAVAASGAQPEYYDYINETSRPILEASPLCEEELYENLRQLALNPQPLLQMSLDGRRIVEQNNDVEIVMDKFLSKCSD